MLISPLVHFTSPSSPLTFYFPLHELLLPRSTICTLSFPPIIFLLYSFALLFSFRNPLISNLHIFCTPLCILFSPDAFYFSPSTFVSSLALEPIIFRRNCADTSVPGILLFCLCVIGLVELVRPPTASPANWARVYCGCKPGPTRVT